MLLDENKIIVRRFFEELWNERKLDVADEIFADDCVTHQLQSGAEVSAAPRNPEAIKEHIGEWLKGFPDLQFSVEQTFGEAEKLLANAQCKALTQALGTVLLQPAKTSVSE